MEFQATIVIPLLRQVDTWLECCVLSAFGQTIPTEVIVVPSERAPLPGLRLLQRLLEEAASLRIGQRENEGYSFYRMLEADRFTARPLVAACKETGS
ncbi:MAG: hypothetical protein OEU36_11520 [Gammaproteobacteria bacterium]|nr:hypothetical protein [Gammaproteobacteria bacterium]